MRRKKLASRIVSILMAGLMMVSTPASVLATDIQIQDDTYQVEVQTASEDAETLGTDGDLGEESTDEEVEYEEITVEEDENLDNVEEFSGDVDEEQIIMEDGEEENEAEPQADEGETDPAATPAADADISVTISMKGNFAKAKNSSKMVQKKVTVKDLDGNGKLTVDEALAATHEAYYRAGTKGYGSAVSEQYGTYLTKLWGNDSGAFGYWDNDTSCMSLDDEVKANDNLVAFVYKDAAGYSDAYAKFAQKEYTAEAGKPLTVAVDKAGYDANYNVVFSAYEGAAITAYDSSFNALAASEYSVDGYQVTFQHPGEYYLMAASGADAILVPTVAKVTVTERTQAELTLDTTECTLYVKGQKGLRYTLEPADENAKVTWTSSDESVATVQDMGNRYGHVWAKSIGKTTITVTVGELSAQCQMEVVETPTLSDLKLYSTQASYNKGHAPLKITPEFQENVYKGYSVEAPDFAAKSLYAVATLSEETLKNGYGTIWYDNAWGGMDRVTAVDGIAKTTAYTKNNALRLQIATNAEYTLNLVSSTTLKNLVIDGVMNKAFDPEETAYHAYVDSTQEGVKINATPYLSIYTITVNDTQITSGEDYILPYQWNENGKMTAKIEVSGSGRTTTVYSVELEKMPLEDTPYILTQPSGADYTVIDKTVKPLTVKASANGELAYQWYYNTTDTTENGTKIEGATESTYTPLNTEAEIGIRYYYCVVTNTGKTENNTATSVTACIVVDPDPTPIARLMNPGAEITDTSYEYPWKKGYVYSVGDTATPLTVEASAKAAGGMFSYQWYSTGSAYNIRSYSTLKDATTTIYIPPTTSGNNNGVYYGCKVTYTFKGKSYTSWATTGETVTEGEGTAAKTYDVQAAYVFVKATEADEPEITKDVVSADYLVGDKAQALSVSATKTDGGQLSYQWYVNDKDSTEDATPIEKATSTSYNLGTLEEAGTKYYFCKVTNTLQGYTAEAYSSIATIAVKTPEEFIGNTFTGAGTEEDPYQISTAEDYQAVYDLVAKGVNFGGKYLKQMKDITLPDGWKPIGKTKNGSSIIQAGANLNAFSGNLDGNNKTITIPEGGLPLLGYVKGASVKDLNIYGTKIAGYGLVNNLSGVGLTGEAICIDNVTLKSGSSTLKSGLIGTEISSSPYAGCSATFYTTIKNCTIEKDVVIGYDKKQSKIGSIAGRMHGTIENCVSYATVYGTTYVGGILGTRDNAMGTCQISNCRFEGTVEASGELAGGIAGGGYSDSSAPNGIKISILNSTASGSVTGKDKVGGILGGDPYVAQAWNTYEFKSNTFTGKVSATAGTYVGGIIGYYTSLNKFDDIVGNHFAADCGAEHGIGYVKYVDTSCTTHETTVGDTYFSTENGTEGCPAVYGCSWKAQHNRTDDPLGADADKLATSKADQAPVVTGLEISGDYKTEYYMGQAFDLTGMVFTATWSDGKVTNPTAEEVQVTGFDTAKKGQQTVTITYKEASANIKVRLLSSIRVTFSLLGDKIHDSDVDGEVHTLTDNNLTVWVPETNYYISPDATVYDVMQEAAEDYGFEMVADDKNQYNSIYIKSITMKGVTLSEFTNGKYSGWMDTINGTHPDVGVAEQVLNDNDVIIFHYTDDYTREEWKGEHIHSWDKGVITKAPTCTEAGILTYTCECGETITEAIPATGHQFGAWNIVSWATVSAPAVQKRSCSVCGYTETQNTGSALNPTISVNMSTIPLKVRQKTSALRVTGLANGDRVVSYRSSNTKIFTVSQSGVLTAGKKTGKATLTITLASGLKKNITVKVQKSTVATTKITGLRSKETLKKGQKLTLRPSRTPLTSTQKFTYKTSNKKVATVNSKGVITAKKPGKAKITVRSGKKKYTVTVTVTK